MYFPSFLKTYFHQINSICNTFSYDVSSNILALLFFCKSIPDLNLAIQILSWQSRLAGWLAGWLPYLVLNAIQLLGSLLYMICVTFFIVAPRLFWILSIHLPAGLPGAQCYPASGITAIHDMCYLFYSRTAPFLDFEHSLASWLTWCSMLSSFWDHCYT